VGATAALEPGPRQIRVAATSRPAIGAAGIGIAGRLNVCAGR
jgi:hypothetical protein